jgi:imidazolonepropionase-like amidohydrolase
MRTETVLTSWSRQISTHKSRVVSCLLAAAAAVFILSSATVRPLAQTGPTVMALVGGRVIASPEAPPIEEAAILIEGGRITAVGPRERVTVPAGAKTIDCRNLILLAGFQNSHVHFTEDRWTDAASQPARKLTAQLQFMLTAYGFTAVVDTGSFLGNTVALRRRIETREVSGPRILTAGLPLYPPNGIPYYLKDGSVPQELLNLLPQPSTPKEAELAVIQNIEAGADIVKLFAGSWVTNQRVLPMPADIAIAAVQEAHRRGRLVFAHTSSVAALEVDLSAGVDVIAHALDDTRGLTAEHLRRMKRQNVTLIPTLTLFAEAQNASEIFREVVDYAARGGEVLFGTDVGYHQMYNPRLEYESLSKAELSWRQILASLTTNPARRFDEGNRRGQLAPGMNGDIVILGSDPGTGSQAFTNVRYTIRAGEVICQRPETR